MICRRDRRSGGKIDKREKIGAGSYVPEIQKFESRLESVVDDQMLC